MSRRRNKRGAPRPLWAHWFILLALLGGLALALTVQGYMHHLAGVGHPAAPAAVAAGSVPKDVLEGGPVIDARGGAILTVSPPDRTLALTFDDGPDPVWTPRILDVLRKHRVHATFFVVGSAAIEHPELVRRIVAEGHEIGVHTLTHTDLGSTPEWRQQIEIQADQQAIAAITGRTATLLRPPFSSDNAAVSDGTWEAVQAAADQGYLTVLSTRDSKDWQRPGADAIGRNIAPSG